MLKEIDMTTAKLLYDCSTKEEFIDKFDSRERALTNLWELAKTYQQIAHAINDIIELK
jgi:hypothetical protein